MVSTLHNARLLISWLRAGFWVLRPTKPCKEKTAELMLSTECRTGRQATAGLVCRGVRACLWMSHQLQPYLVHVEVTSGVGGVH